MVRGHGGLAQQLRQRPRVRHVALHRGHHGGRRPGAWRAVQASARPGRRRRRPATATARTSGRPRRPRPRLAGPRWSGGAAGPALADGRAPARPGSVPASATRKVSSGGPPIATHRAVGASAWLMASRAPRETAPRATGRGPPRRRPTSRRRPAATPRSRSSSRWPSGQHARTSPPRRSASAAQAYQATLTSQESSGTKNAQAECQPESRRRRAGSCARAPRPAAPGRPPPAARRRPAGTRRPAPGRRRSRPGRPAGSAGRRSHRKLRRRSPARGRRLAGPGASGGGLVQHGSSCLLPKALDHVSVAGPGTGGCRRMGHGSGWFRWVHEIAAI